VTTHAATLRMKARSSERRVAGPKDGLIGRNDAFLTSGTTGAVMSSVSRMTPQRARPTAGSPARWISLTHSAQSAAFRVREIE